MPECEIYKIELAEGEQNIFDDLVFLIICIISIICGFLFTRRVTPDSVWYCRVLPHLSFSAITDTGSRSFDCALVSAMERHKGRLLI